MSSKTYLTDLEIAQQAKLRPIAEIAAKAGLSEEQYEPYGRFIGKARLGLLEELADRPDGKLVLVTAITPTKAGEGKSTTSVGLGDGLSALGKRTMIAIREPSLGPCFGTKGGATGGGYAQVLPMEQINLHFTGDLHAITAAHNLLAALVANHVHQGNELGLDVRRVQWRHVMDLNARHLRQIVCALGGLSNGFPMESGFDITTSSEIMAILCLARDVRDLKERLGRIYVGQSLGREYLYARDFSAAGPMAVLLRDAIRPNLVQTLEGTPALVHGGPFANIAHGCNSVIATKLALKLADYVVTEAGFGSDLGAEKFFDIKCRQAGLTPNAAVVVATLRALRLHGGVKDSEVNIPAPQAVERGLANLGRHIANVQRFGLPVVVALNAFVSDSEEERALVREFCAGLGVRVALSEVWEHGGKGGEELAREVVALSEQPSSFRFLYPLELSLQQKIETIAKEVYGAGEVRFSAGARQKLASFTKNGYGEVPVCIAKTPASFSGDPTLLNAPSGFTLEIGDVRLSAGAGFVVALAGEIMTMPGLGRVPAANHMDLTDDGSIVGLF